MKLRAATLTDAAAVTALLGAAYGELLRGSYDDALLSRALPFMTCANPTLLASTTFYLVVAEPDAVVGCGGWTRERPGSGEVSPGLTHLRHFATHPDHGRRGVGRMLFERCEREARAAGSDTLECYATRPAVAFYTSLGFKTVRSIDIQMSEDVVFPSILMRRLC